MCCFHSLFQAENTDTVVPGSEGPRSRWARGAAPTGRHPQMPSPCPTNLQSAAFPSCSPDFTIIFSLFTISPLPQPGLNCAPAHTPGGTQWLLPWRPPPQGSGPRTAPSFFLLHRLSRPCLLGETQLFPSLTTVYALL